MRSIAKCKSEIHHDSGSDIKAVRAGIDRKNIVMKPLSLHVMLSAIWYATRPIDAATIVPKIISIIAKICPKWSSERRYKTKPTTGPGHRLRRKNSRPPLQTRRISKTICRRGFRPTLNRSALEPHRARSHAGRCQRVGLSSVARPRQLDSRRSPLRQETRPPGNQKILQAILELALWIRLAPLRLPKRASD